MINQRSCSCQTIIKHFSRFLRFLLALIEIISSFSSSDSKRHFPERNPQLLLNSSYFDFFFLYLKQHQKSQSKFAEISIVLLFYHNSRKLSICWMENMIFKKKKIIDDKICIQNCWLKLSKIVYGWQSAIKKR